MSTPALAALALVAFVTEVALFGGVGAVAHHLAGGGGAGWVAAVLATATVLVVWGSFMAPKARWRLGVGPRTVVAVVLVWGTAYGLLRSGFTGWAWFVGVAGLAVVAAQTVLHQPAPSDAEPDPGP